MVDEGTIAYSEVRMGCLGERTVVTRGGELELWDGELFMLERRRRGVKQLELARECGVYQVAISRWEAGCDMPEWASERLWQALEAEGRGRGVKPTRGAMGRPRVNGVDALEAEAEIEIGDDEAGENVA